MVRVIIIDEDATVRQTAREAAVHVPNVQVLADTDSLVYGYELIRQNRPEVVFIDFRDDAEKTLDVIRRISTYFKETVIFVSGSDMTLESTIAAMQAGAREYLQRPLTGNVVVEVIERHLNTVTVDSSEGDTSGRIITVFSNKGGLGKTTLAVNLALAISETIQKPVALVDLNLQLGDVTTFLDILPNQTIVDIARNIGRVDAAYLESSLAQYKRDKSTLYVVADPLFVEDAEEVTADQINTILTVLKAVYEYVIIDTTTSFDSKTLTAMDLADYILLVSMVNLPTIRSSQRVLTLFNRLGYDEYKVKMILNRYMADEEITVEDVEETLEFPVYWKIPNNYNVVMTAINRGIPIFDIENSQALWNNFLALAKQLCGVIESPNAVNGKEGADNVPEKGFLSGLFSKKS